MKEDLNTCAKINLEIQSLRATVDTSTVDARPTVDAFLEILASTVGRRDCSGVLKCLFLTQFLQGP